ncbi:MAG: DinB family protein, partial [Candidatus Thorarchaeota archaeon]
MELDELIQYKIWADNTYLNYCKSLTEEQLRKTMSDYNRSIRSILEHICEVNWFWYEFLTTKQFSNQPDFTVMISAELFTCISDYNDKLLIYISKNDLKKKFIMQWNKKDKPVQTTAENV